MVGVIFTPLLFQARITELTFLLSSFPHADILSMRRHGRFLYNAYFSSPRAVLDSMLAAVRSRLLIPPMPATGQVRSEVFFCCWNRNVWKDLVRDMGHRIFAEYLRDGVCCFTVSVFQFFPHNFPQKIFHLNTQMVSQNTEKLRCIATTKIHWRNFALKTISVFRWNSCGLLKCLNSLLAVTKIKPFKKNPDHRKTFLAKCVWMSYTTLLHHLKAVAVNLSNPGTLFLKTLTWAPLVCCATFNVGAWWKSRHCCDKTDKFFTLAFRKYFGIPTGDPVKNHCLKTNCLIRCRFILYSCALFVCTLFALKCVQGLCSHWIDTHRLASSYRDGSDHCFTC